MKKLFTLILSLALVTPVLAQDAPLVENKQSKHEIGIDITQFFSQILGFGNPPYYYGFAPYPYYGGYYNQPQVLFYRLKVGNGKVRVGLGGSYQYNENFRYNGQDIDPNLAVRKSNNLNVTLGYEASCAINGKWDAYYGADLGYGMNSFYYEGTYQNQGYYVGQTGTVMGLSLSALAGIRFKLNDRISFSTEAHIKCDYTMSNSTTFYEAVSSANPPKADVHTPEQKSFNTGFLPPINLQFFLRL